jgi:uncharacterized protein with von Willebrand factor type A (vWA) domain
MFVDFLYRLRAQGLVVGVGEWLGFLEALRRGLAVDTAGLYRLGRALLCRSEADFDAFDVAFAASFQGVELRPDLRSRVEEWLAAAAAARLDTPALDERRSLEELWKELLKRLEQQKERHDGGNYWIGTGGTSPFGHSGRGKGGIRIGGEGGGGGAVQVAMERRWARYRSDCTLDVRDLEVALRTLRALKREGSVELDLDATIEKTGKNAGEIEVVERPARRNQVHLVLLMDSGGSMTPHTERVERLFSAAARVRTFRSFKSYIFHNCVYDHLYVDPEASERVPTTQVLEGLTARHRVVFVGDASMAPHELFSAYGWPGMERLAGIEWLRRLAQRCPSSVWLNPDPPRWWEHPTVSAVRSLFPMYELSVDGLRSAVRKLRAPI